MQELFTENQGIVPQINDSSFCVICSLYYTKFQDPSTEPGFRGCRFQTSEIENPSRWLGGNFSLCIINRCPADQQYAIACWKRRRMRCEAVAKGHAFDFRSHHGAFHVVYCAHIAAQTLQTTIHLHALYITYATFTSHLAGGYHIQCTNDKSSTFMCVVHSRWYNSNRHITITCNIQADILTEYWSHIAVNVI